MIPVAQAGPEQAYAFSTLPKLVTLSGNALNGPITDWEWTMLAVPSGSSADVGVNGDFTDGVSTVQNAQFTADVAEGYVLQLRAKNSSGWSEPAYDREEAQTAVYILTEELALRIPGAYLYRYDTDLNQTIRDAEAILATHAARHEAGGDDEISVAGLSGELTDAQPPKAHASSHEGGADALTVDAAAVTGSLRTLGTSATSACAGDDSRLSDARTPTAHATSHEDSGGDEISVAGLSGVLADAQNADQLQGRDIATTAPNDGDVYKWNSVASEWQPDVGGGGGGNNMIAMAINENTDSSSDVIVGALGVAGAFFTTLTVKFVVTAYVTTSGLTGSVELYNLTDATSESILTFTELVSTRKSSAALTLNAAEKMYEIRFKVTGSGGPAERVVCMWAGLEAEV